MRLNRIFQRLFEVSQKLKAENDSAAHDLVRRNIRHFSSLSLVLIVLFGVLLLIHWNLEAGLPSECWRSGIVLCYGVLAAVMVGLRAALQFMDQREGDIRALQAVQWAGLLAILGGGLAVTAIDPLGTGSITPFLIACLAASLLFLLRPLHYLVLYPLVFAVFFVVVGLARVDPAVVLSNRINGFAAVVIALALSAVLRQSAVASALQVRSLKERQKDLEEKNRHLEKLAYYDTLTGLCNRRLFWILVERELADLRRYRLPASLLLIDLDSFKWVNDTYGHPTGDRVLVQAAEVIRSGLREGDLVARWGGEEFLCVLRNTNLEGAAVAAEKIRRAIERTPFGRDSETFSMTASIGIAPLVYFSEKSFEACYERVDEALYQAKGNGKNCYVVYDRPILSEDGRQAASAGRVESGSGAAPKTPPAPSISGAQPPAGPR